MEEGLESDAILHGGHPSRTRPSQPQKNNGRQSHRERVGLPWLGKPPRLTNTLNRSLAVPFPTVFRSTPSDMSERGGQGIKSAGNSAAWEPVPRPNPLVGDVQNQLPTWMRQGEAQLPARPIA